MRDKLRFAGVMVGSSLDGIDLAVYDWNTVYQDEKLIGLSAQLIASNTFTLDSRNGDLIKSARMGRKIVNAEYAREFTHYISELLVQNVPVPWKQLAAGLVYHGPTLMHKPGRKESQQLGKGQILANRLGIPVMCDLRMADMNAGGEGAPLMPILDKWCFSQYDATLNLGGIANISLELDGKRLGWDICGCNQLLDFAAGLLNYSYDANGELARSGKRIPEIKSRLEDFKFLDQNPPKSLSNEEVAQYGIDGISRIVAKIDPRDLLATYVSHIASQVGDVVREYRLKNLLVSGGGARNVFLIESIQQLCPNLEIIVPEESLLIYKECQMLSLMALLNVLGYPNALATVTGADRDTIGGHWYKSEAYE